MNQKDNVYFKFDKSMSYSNYPLGVSDNTPNVPWNESEQPTKSFDVTVSQSLSKSLSVKTSDYIPEEDWDDTADTDWKDIYESANYTPIELIQAFGEYLTKELKDHPDLPRGTKMKYKNLIDSCKDWCLDDYEVIRD